MLARMQPSRFIQLTDDQDLRLRDIEQNAHLKPKVRVRAQVVRLSHRRHTIQQIAAYTGRHRSSISRDLDRWETHGVAGLADGTAPGNVSPITTTVKTWLRERLAEERTWTAGQLAEAVTDDFGITVTAETIRQHLLALGYAWKRTRYVPAKAPDPDEERTARAHLAGLKRGLVTAR
jgi:transposase